MYAKIVNDWKAHFPDFPKEPSVELGLAIKALRLRQGITQDELARHAKIKPTALKTLENGYAKFTKLANLNAIGKVLQVPLKEILGLAREWFLGNFFVLKSSPSPRTPAKRRRKRREDVWFQTKALRYDGLEIHIVSAPVTWPGHFILALCELSPMKKVGPLQLGFEGEAAGYVTRGSLNVRYDERDFHLFANQGFAFRADRPHYFFNPDKENSAHFVLAFPGGTGNSAVPTRTSASAKAASPSFSIGRAIQKIRTLYSDTADRPLSFPALAHLTGLDIQELQYLERTTGADQVIYWDKVEKITRSLGLSFERFLDFAEGRDTGYFHLATAHDRAFIDYRHFLGVRLKSALLPKTTNAFHIAEMFIEPKGGIRRLAWQRTDQAMAAVYVEDGELLVEVGQNRKARLFAGESVYFDAGVGYIFSNPGQRPAKVLIATYPGIVY